MKKFVTLAVLAGISSVAAAQSSVTLFGVVDEAARYTKNGDLHLKSLVSGGINTSRFGVRGTEDLGGGLAAGFWLESGFNADNGSNSSATTYWNRRSTVSLIGNFGEVRLGRDYTPTYLGYTDYDAFGDNGVAASSKFDSNLDSNRADNTRSPNQIMYLLPSNIGGVYGRFSVAAGEGAAGTKYEGGRVGYAVGPVDVSVSYGQTKVGASPTDGSDKYKLAAVGASYDFGFVKALGYFTQTKYSTEKIQTISLGAIAPVGGVGQVKFQYTHANVSGTSANAAKVDIDSNDGQQFAVGYIYNLSKRTALYTTAAYVKNKGNATFNTNSALALAAGQNSKAIEAGIRHAF